MKATQAQATELREAAVTAEAAAIEARTKFVRIAKKMALPARMRANAQVVTKQEEADALKRDGMAIALCVFIRCRLRAM